MRKLSTCSDIMKSLTGYEHIIKWLLFTKCKHNPNQRLSNKVSRLAPYYNNLRAFAKWLEFDYASLSDMCGYVRKHQQLVYFL